MNNLKEDSVKFTNHLQNENQFWRSKSNNLENRLEIQLPEIGSLLSLNKDINLNEIRSLRNKAKNINVKLPIYFDPNRHFGYEIIPDYLYINSNKKTCCPLDIFLPQNPPYVPLILRCLINHLEDHCFNIEYLYYRGLKFGSRAKRILINLANCEQNYFTMRDLIRHEAVQNIALAVLLFLKALCPVLLLQKKQEFNDKKEVDMNYLSCLHCSCFLMIHFLHIWEYSKDPGITLCLLAKVFGPIMLKNKDNEDEDEDSINSFIILMLNYDYDFWYGLSKMPIKIFRLFNGVTSKEAKYLNFRHNKLFCK